jgi:rabenosyn-5
MSFFGDDKGKSLEPSKLHWKPDTWSQVCMDATCCKKFNAFSRRKHHCRMCGCLFCQDCLFLERRLNIQAKPDPYSSWLSRVCRGCFFDAAKPEEVGSVVSRTKEFEERRAKKLDQMSGERHKFAKLAEYVPFDLKHTHVPWEKNEDKTKCGCTGCTYCSKDGTVRSDCGRSFKGVSEGKHHCRLCGKIFCDGCSRHRVTLPHMADVNIYLLKKATPESAAALAAGPADDASAALRVCQTCFFDCRRYERELSAFYIL